MKLYIKDMLTLNSQVIVRGELMRLGLHPISVDRGVADIRESPVQVQQRELRMALAEAGFELLEDKKDILILQIKNIIMEVVYDTGEPLVYNLSEYLSDRLSHDYTYMSNLFSERLDTTIEKFYIRHKIERVKDMLLFEGLTLTEIAYKMHYSSLAHLSSQFKKITGQTTSQFKRQNSRNQPMRAEY
ncbi:MAG TPA: helix-turn-helix domain-containing protein [Puia sp.]|nr:helix-turn-helix domain-containing protein [Puia sp.]